MHAIFWLTRSFLFEYSVIVAYLINVRGCVDIVPGGFNRVLLKILLKGTNRFSQTCWGKFCWPLFNFFRKKSHWISNLNVRLDTLKNPRYGYQIEHWLLDHFDLHSWNRFVLKTWVLIFLPEETMKWKQKWKLKIWSSVISQQHTTCFGWGILEGFIMAINL